jgi:signal recognition particle subunit SRP72
LAHIHLQLYKSQTSSSNNEKKPSIPDIISTLECLPTRPAIQATLASLYHQNGQSDKVQSILNHLREQQSSDNDNNNNMAQLYMQMSMYSNALDLLSNENNDDNTCQAMKVIALHELGQVEDAMDEWKSFKELNNIMDDYSSVDAEALEANVIPRLHKSSITHASFKTHDSKKKKEKKRCEAVLKKRAKQREAYLEKHTDLKNKTPDPERWIPKRDRVAKRRYNSNKHMNAAQGITSQKDMNKLDAYARTTNPHSQSSQNQPSTRHMSVSATGKNRRAAR